MSKVINKFILLIVLLSSVLFSSQKEVNNIAQISAVALYNIDQISLDANINAYIRNNPTIKALKITEELSDEIYISIYKNKEGKFVKGILPSSVKSYRLYKSTSYYENEKVGEIYAYYDNKDLIQLTNDEKTWLHTNKITLSVDNRYAPMNFLNSRGQIDGLSIDYIKLIEKKIGYPILLDSNTWPISLNNAMTHKSDGIINANSTPQREKKLIFSESYITVPMVLITVNSTKEYNNLKELQNKTILVKEKTVEASVLPKKYPSIKFKEVKTYKDALMKVSLGNADGVFGHMAVLEYEKNKYLISNIKKNFVSFDEIITAQAIGIRKTAPLLKTIVDKAILSFTKEEKRKINEKWMKPIEKKSNELSQDEISWVKQNPPITMAVIDNYPPYDFKDEKNNLKGFHTDLINIVNKNLGTNIIIKPFNSWSEAYKSAINGSVNGILSLSWSKEREEKYFTYSTPYHFSPYYLAVKKDNTDITSLESLKNKKVAVEIDTIFEDVVKEKVSNANIILVKNTKEAYASVLRGDSFATISPNINDAQFKNSGLKVVSEIYHKSSNLYAGINKRYPIVASIMTKGIDSISLQEISNLRQKWFTKNKSTIELNEKERKWIEKNPEVKVIKFFDEPPFTINGAEKSGYIYELVEYLIKSTGLSIKYVNSLNSYDDMLNSLEEGKNDILTTFPTSLDLGKDSNIAKSKSILKTPFILIGKSDNKNVNSMKELNGEKIAVVKGYVQDKYLNSFPKIKKYYVNNNEEGFQALRSGKAKYYINNKANSEYVLNKSFATDLKIVYQLPYDKFPPLSISFAMNGQKKTLVSILNKALEQVPYKKIKTIRDKWIVSDKDKTDHKQINFTKEEKKWLDDNPAIRIAYMDYWPVNDNNNNIHSEYVGLLSKYGNINITLVKYDSWKKGLESSKIGKNTFGILNLSWSEKREKESFNYTKPYFFTPGYIVVKKGNKTIKSIEDITNSTIFLKENAITNQIIKELKYNISPINLKNEEAMYQALAKKDSKAEALMSYIYNPELLDKYDLKVANKFFSKFGEVHLGVSKNQKELFTILDKIYDVIPKSELSRIQNKTYQKENKIKVKLTKKEKKFIKNNKVIRVHNEKNWPPFNFHEFGQAKGYSVELMKEVAKNTGLNIEFISGPTWDEFLKLMKKGELDVVINIVKNKDREKYMLFTDPFLQTTMGIATNKNTKNIKNFNDMLDKKVALEKGFFYHDYFKKNHPETELHVVNDGLQTLQAVAFKQADTTLGFIPVMKYIAEKNFINNLKYFTDISSPIMQPMPLRFSTRKDTPELLSILQKGLASITPEQQKELSKRWLGSDNSKEKIVLNLTDKENEWLDKQEKIKIGIQKNWAPISYFENDSAEGLSVDYINLINKSLDGKIKIIADNFKNNLNKVDNGTLDAVVDITPNKQREEKYNFTSNYANIPHYIVSTTENKDYYKSVKDLNNKIIAVEKGYGINKLIKQAAPDAKLHYYSNTTEALEALSDNKAQAYIGNLAVVNYYIEKRFISNLTFHGRSDISRSILAIATKKDQKILRDILQKALKAIPKEETLKIQKNYMDMINEKKVKLNKKEQNWVDKKIPIKYVFDSDWAPFEWKNELNEHTGIVYDLLHLITERTGIILEPVPTENWSQAVQLAESKQIDMYGGLGENEDRKKYMNFTKNTLYKTPYVFIVHKDNENDYFDTFNSLKHNEKIAVVDEYTIEGIMKDKQPEVNIHTVSSIMEGFRQLENKDIDIFLVNAATAKYYINRKGFTDLKIATKTEYQLEIKSAIRNDWPPEVISILDKALASISDKELSDIYLKWTEISVEKKIDWILIYEIVAGALVLILLGAYWNRRLKKAVDSKTKELQKLLESFDENVIASKTDDKGQILYASKAFCKISGYTEEELIGQPQNIVRHPDTPKELFKGLWKTIQSGKIWRGELRNRKKDGGFYWVDAVITPDFDIKGKIIGYSAIRNDITSQKEVEEKTKILNIQKKELENMLEIFDENIISSKSDLNGYITSASKAFAKITGYEVDELIGLPHSTVRHPEMPCKTFKNLWETVQSGKVWKGEIKNLSKDGSHYWVEAVITPEFDEDGVITGYSAIRQDITSKKAVEELSANLEIKVEERTKELDENVTFMNTLIQNLPTAVFAKNVNDDFRFITWNKHSEELFGMKSEDMLGKNDFDFFPKEEAELFLKTDQEVVRKNKVTEIPEETVTTAKGEKILNTLKIGIPDENGKPNILLGIAIDITEQKKAQQTILDQQQQFSSMASNVPGVIYRCKVDAVWTMLYISDEIENLSGYPVSDFINNSVRTFADIMYGDDIEPVAILIQNQIDKGEKFIVDYRVVDTDGTIKWVRSQGQVYSNDEGEQYLDGVLFDVTEQRKLEEEIKESKERFTTLFDAAPDSIALIKDGKYIACNQKTLEIFGIKSEELFIENKPSDYSPELQENNEKSETLATEKINQTITDGYSRFEWIHKRMDVNKNFDAEVILSSIVLGGEAHIYAVVRDISERKELERQIHEKQEQIAQNKLFVDTLLDSQEQMVITTDGIKLRSCNKAFLDLFDIDNIDDFTKDYDCICDRFETDESGTYLQKAMDDTSWIEYILKHEDKTHKAVILKNGYERIFTVTAAILPLGKGDIKSAVFTDITEMENIRKNIELILSNIMLPVLITSKKDRTILYANEYASKQYEASVEELIGSNIDDIYTTSNQKDEILDEMDTLGYVENLEEKYKTKNGKEFIALLSVKPIVYDTEDAYIGMVVDITEQKIIEEEIRKIHKHTKDSIEYASLIQSALIPDEIVFNHFFQDSFAIWQPKDIVGGDIYLMHELNENEVVLMVIDCTGHGVPGAFVTMLVKAIERQIMANIHMDNRVSPSNILEIFNKSIKHLLNQENIDSVSNAGFDGGILYYNKIKKQIKYSGAETPLFYIKDGEVTMIKGSRHSIGYKKSDMNFEFEEHTIDVVEGMRFYLTTDGYFDQNGGEKSFPFGKKKFSNIISEHHEKQFSKQKDILLDRLMEYQNDEERNDDVTVVGFQI